MSSLAPHAAVRSSPRSTGLAEPLVRSCCSRPTIQETAPKVPQRCYGGF